MAFGLRDSKFHVGSAFGAKYLTAEIEDDARNLYIVQIKKKHMLHGHFFVKLGGEIYIFRVQPDKVKTIRNWGTHPVSVAHYSTRHFLPLDLGQLADLEEFKRNNPDIKRIDEVQAVLLGAARALEEANREAVLKDGTMPAVAISLPDAVEYVMSGADPANPITAERMAEYTAAMDRLGARSVVGPIALATDYLDETIQSSSLAIMAILKQLEIKHFQWVKIANPAKTPFQHWALVAVLAIAGAAAIGGGYFLLGGEGGPFSGGLTFEDLQRMASEGLPPPGSTAPPADVPAAPAVPPPPPAAAPAPTAAPAAPPAAGPTTPLDAITGTFQDPSGAFDQIRGLGAQVLPGVDAPAASAPSAPTAAPAPVAAGPGTTDLGEVAARMAERRAAELEQLRHEVAANQTLDTRSYYSMSTAEWEDTNKVWCAYYAVQCIDELQRLALLADTDQPREERVNECMNRYSIPDPVRPDDKTEIWAPCGLSAVEAAEYSSRDWESLFSHPNFTRTGGN